MKPHVGPHSRIRAYNNPGDYLVAHAQKRLVRIRTRVGNVMASTLACLQLCRLKRIIGEVFSPQTSIVSTTVDVAENMTLCQCDGSFTIGLSLLSKLRFVISSRSLDMRPYWVQYCVAVLSSIFYWSFSANPIQETIRLLSLYSHIIYMKEIWLTSNERPYSRYGSFMIGGLTLLFHSHWKSPKLGVYTSLLFFVDVWLYIPTDDLPIKLQSSHGNFVAAALDYAPLITTRRTNTSNIETCNMHVHIYMYMYIHLS